MLHLDFEFQLDSTHLAIVGWCGVELLDSLYIQDKEQVLFPVLVSRHPRHDLRSDDFRGFVALFETKPDIDLIECSFRAEGDSSMFALEGDVSQFSAFVHKAVDETFWNFCLQVGAGALSLRGSAMVSLIRQRIQNALGNYGKTPRMAAGVDQAISVEPRGVALVSGWMASDQSQHADHVLRRSGFVVCDGALVPIEMYWDCHLRPDLSGFSDRFSLTGHEGFAGIAQTSPKDGEIETVVICTQYRHAQVVLVRNVDATSAQAILSSARKMDAQLTAPNLLHDIRIALRPRATYIEMLPTEEFPKLDSGVTLVLEHDANDHDLRDILRLSRSALGNNISLIVIRKSISRSLARAIQSDQNESGSGKFKFDSCAPDTPINQWPVSSDVVVFASSSALLQLDPFAEFSKLPGLKKDGAVMLFDPILGLSAKPTQKQMAARLATGRTPLIAMLNMAALPKTNGLFEEFMTAEAQVRVMILSLYQKGRINLVLAPPTTYFDGAAGRSIDDPENTETAALLAGLDSEAIAEVFLEQSE